MVTKVKTLMFWDILSPNKFGWTTLMMGGKFYLKWCGSWRKDLVNGGDLDFLTLGCVKASTFPWRWGPRWATANSFIQGTDVPRQKLVRIFFISCWESSLAFIFSSISFSCSTNMNKITPQEGQWMLHEMVWCSWLCYWIIPYLRSQVPLYLHNSLWFLSLSKRTIGGG